MVEDNDSLTTKEQNEQLDTLLDSLDATTEVYYEYITILLIIHTLSIAYLFQNFQEVIYSRLKGIYTKVLGVSLILNIVTTLIVFYWLYKYIFEYTVNLDDIDTQRRVKAIIDRMDGDSEFSLELSVAVLTSIQYARMIFALQMSRTFGPMVKILGNMLVDLVIFIFMYLLVFLIFTCASQLLFSDVNGYGDFVSCAITLFSASLGDFNYSDFEAEGQSEFQKYLGYVFMTTYLTVSMITLLNFLIAILSNTYDYLQQHKNALYLREVVLLRQKYRYDAKYSSIVSAFVPLNILNLVLSPTIISFKSKKLNHLVLLCEYIIFGALSIVLHLAISLILMPVAYVLVVVNKVRYCFKKPFIGRCDLLLRVFDLIIFIFIGILWLLILCFWDTIGKILLFH